MSKNRKITKDIGRLATLLTVSVVEALCGEASAAEETFVASYRSIGEIEVSFRETADGSETTFACASPEKARILASKRKGDLLGYGNLVEHSGDRLHLAGTGTWTLELKGNALVETFEKGGLAPERKGGSVISAAGHPHWMDGFDAYGAALWDIGGGKMWDLPTDLDWLKSLDLAMCGVKPSLNRLVAPGVFDDSILDWRKAVAGKYGFAYRQLLFPREPISWIWNLSPLPYVEPAEDYVHMPYYFNLGSMTHGQGLAMPIPQLDRYIFDGRYRLARQFGGDDSRLLGWHGCDELGTPTIHSLMAVARTPGVVAAWKKAHPDGGAVPDAKDFLGWNPKTDLDLRGGWEIKTAEGKWIPFDWNDPMLSLAHFYTYKREFGDLNNLPEKRATWLRRTLRVDVGKVGLRYLHLARNSQRRPRPGAVNFVFPLRVNGKTASLTECRFSDCYDVGGLLKEGENVIEINTWGQSIPGYVFLNNTRAVNYPDFGAKLNRRWHDAIEFVSGLWMEKVAGDLRAMRAGDPVRPLKMMSPKAMLDLVLPICMKYGAYVHDTGLAGGCWAPMTGAGVSRSHGLPFSCEQAGPPGAGANGVTDLRRTVTLYLNYANAAADLVFSAQHYRDNPPVKKWMEDHLPLVKNIGKLCIPRPQVAVLRTSRQDRYDLDQQWNFDIARGPLQCLGRNFAYLESCDFLNPGLLDRYPVIFDAGTLVMEPSEAEALRDYVARGGTFVAQHHTGVHTFDQANAHPLDQVMSKLPEAAKGRFIRLAARQWNDTKTLGGILDRLGIPRESKSNVWGTRMASKNGVYDVYLSSHVDAPHMKNGTNTLAVSAAFARGERPSAVWDFGAKGCPKVDFAWADGWLQVPDTEFRPYETRVYAAPSATPGLAGVRWIREQARLWPPLAVVEPPAAVAPDPDYLSLDGGWTVEANGETRPVDKPKTHVELGLPRDASVVYRKTVQLPSGWRGRNLRLVFDAEGWFWGIAPKGKLSVRWEGGSAQVNFGVAIAATKAIDLCPAGDSVALELAIDGTVPAPKMPSGVTGVFFLRRLPEADRIVAVAESYACTDYGVRRRIRRGERAPHRFFELRFETPADAQRLWLKAEAPLTGLILNGRAVETRNRWLNCLDITNLVRRDGRPNVLYWSPEIGIFHGVPASPRDDALPGVDLLVQQEKER